MCKELVISMISDKKSLDRFLEMGRKNKWGVDRCSACRVGIYNSENPREPKGVFEKIMAKMFKNKYKKWDTNFGGAFWDSRIVVCDNLGCYIKASQDLFVFGNSPSNGDKKK